MYNISMYIRKEILEEAQSILGHQNIPDFNTDEYFEFIGELENSGDPKKVALANKLEGGAAFENVGDPFHEQRKDAESKRRKKALFGWVFERKDPETGDNAFSKNKMLFIGGALFLSFIAMVFWNSRSNASTPSNEVVEEASLIQEGEGDIEEEVVTEEGNETNSRFGIQVPQNLSAIVPDIDLGVNPPPSAEVQEENTDEARVGNNSSSNNATREGQSQRVSPSPNNLADTTSATTFEGKITVNRNDPRIERINLTQSNSNFTRNVNHNPIAVEQGTVTRGTLQIQRGVSLQQNETGNQVTLGSSANESSTSNLVVSRANERSNGKVGLGSQNTTDNAVEVNGVSNNSTVSHSNNNHNNDVVLQSQNTGRNVTVGNRAQEASESSTPIAQNNTNNNVQGNNSQQDGNVVLESQNVNQAMMANNSGAQQEPQPSTVIPQTIGGNNVETIAMQNNTATEVNNTGANQESTNDENGNSFIAAIERAREKLRQQTEPVRPDIDYAIGDLLNGSMVFGFLTTTNSQLPILVIDENNIVWRGTGSLNELSRVDIQLTSYIKDGEEVNTLALILGIDEYPGVQATIQDESPNLAENMIQAGLRGVTDYVKDLGNEQKVTRSEDKTVTIEDKTVPLELAIAGSISELFVPLNNTRGLVRIAKVPVGTAVKIMIVGEGIEGDASGARETTINQ